MSSKFLLPVAITAIGVGIISFTFLAKPKPVPRELPNVDSTIKVAVTEAQPETVRLSVKTQGTVKPIREINIVAQVSGQIVEVMPQFIDGEFFEASQLLLKIDDREYQAALLSAKARVAEAEQLLAEEKGRNRQAQREWRDLGDDNANHLFLRKPQLAAASAALESARGALAIARLNLERTKIAVPFNGRVKSTLVDLGQFVSIGTPIATVYDSESVEVRLPLTEKEAYLLNLPLSGKTAPNRSAVTISGRVAGHPHQWQGQITRMDAFIDERSRMYYAIAEVNQPFSGEYPLLPGLFVDAEIQGKEISNVLELPRSALYERNKILLVNGERKIDVHDVEVLRRTEEQVWVKAPLDDVALVSLEKQSITPQGTEVEPQINDGLQANTEAAQLTTSTSSTR